MAQPPHSTKAREAEGLTQGEAIAVVFALVWMVVVALLFWAALPADMPGQGFSGAHWALVGIAVLTPVGLLWVAALQSRAVRQLREDLFQTQTAIVRLNDMLASQQAKDAPKARTATPAAAQGPVSSFASRREVSRLIVPRAAPQVPADQPPLALDTPPEDTSPPIARPDLIRGLNFPDDENDTEGFAALRRALRDRGARKLVQASQDVLTLMSQDGIYMDDLRPAPASADLWRRFAHGERGKSVDGLGGIKDQTCLSLISRRMREDTIFRDSVHHFLRCFDQLLVTFEEQATDTDLLELAETRTTRAFMLLGRATGTFD